MVIFFHATCSAVIPPQRLDVDTLKANSLLLLKVYFEVNHNDGSIDMFQVVVSYDMINTTTNITTLDSEK